MMKICFITLKNGTKNFQEKDESLRMGLRQDKRAFELVAQDETER